MKLPTHYLQVRGVLPPGLMRSCHMCARLTARRALKDQPLLCPHGPGLCLFLGCFFRLL